MGRQSAVYKVTRILLSYTSIHSAQSHFKFGESFIYIYIYIANRMFAYVSTSHQ